LGLSIENNFQRRCVRYDTYKELHSSLCNTVYDAILLDFAEERYDIIKYKGSIATLSEEFSRTGLQNQVGVKIFKPSNFCRRWHWKMGLNKIISIAKERDVPVFLNKIFPAFCDEKGNNYHSTYINRERKYLNWFYNHTPKSVNRFLVPDDILIADSNHRWGKGQLHFVQDVYEYLLKQLDDALADIS